MFFIYGLSKIVSFTINLKLKLTIYYLFFFSFEPSNFRPTLTHLWLQVSDSSLVCSLLKACINKDGISHTKSYSSIQMKWSNIYKDVWLNKELKNSILYSEYMFCRALFFFLNHYLLESFISCLFCLASYIWQSVF